MSLRDYLTYIRLEREFNLNDPIWKVPYNDPKLYIDGLREGKRDAIKRMAKRSLITLATLVALTGSGLYLHSSNDEYNKILAEASRKADLNGDGEISSPRETAEFFNSLPYPAKYFIRP